MKRLREVFTGRLAPILRAGLIAGVAVAAVTYPLAAVGGLGVKAGAELYQSLPGELRTVPPAQTSYVYASDNKTLLTMFYEEYRKYTPIGEISENIQRAIVASEDGRFYDHHGVDVKGVARAFVANHSAGTVSQGASTLTMQYVRMALRDSAKTPADVLDATEQTTGRKIREMRLALRIEQEMTKIDILERYLNIAYFGHRAYGVHAAAQIFFSKLPKDLTVTEAATLAGLVKAPSAYDPAGSDPTAATDRRNYVIDRMASLNYVTQEQAEKSKADPITLKVTEPPNDCVSIKPALNGWGFFCDALKNWWRQQSAFGDTPSEREDALRRGGYRIVTSIDPAIQQIAQEQVSKREGNNSSYAHGEVVIQPGTGLIKAMAVNRTYSLDQSGNGENSRDGETRKGSYPNTVNPLLGGGDLPGYQAGSTFKMFTMLAALDAGLPMNTWFYAPNRYKSIYFSGWGEPASCSDGSWCPANASGAMTGNHAMWSGFGKSVNTYFVQLEQKVGAERVVRMAEKLGLRWRTDIDKLQASPLKANSWGTFTLGVSDTTPMEMANAYAAVAADGKYCEALPVVSILNPQGNEAMMPASGDRMIPIAAPRCKQVVRPDVARAAADAARCVTGYGAAKGGCGGWSTASGVYGTVGRPVAGKTGTTDNNRAAWFVAFTPQLAAASFFADPDNPFHAAGGNAYKPIETVSYTLRDALAGQPRKDFTPPSSKILGKQPPMKKAPPKKKAATNAGRPRP